MYIDRALIIAGIVGALFIGGIFWLLVAVASHEAEQRRAFMAECLTERKQYECTAMWRDGRFGAVPAPFVIPAR